MKWTIIIFVMIISFACNKEEIKISRLTATVEGKEINFIGNAHRYKDIKNNIPTDYNYHIFNLETPKLYIEIIDSSFVKQRFEFPDFNAKYVFSIENNILKNYTAINGNVNFLKEEKGVLIGEFHFSCVNTLDDTDTIHIEDGFFEITLKKNDRLWDY